MQITTFYRVEVKENEHYNSIDCYDNLDEAIVRAKEVGGCVDRHIDLTYDNGDYSVFQDGQDSLIIDEVYPNFKNIFIRQEIEV